MDNSVQSPNPDTPKPSDVLQKVRQRNQAIAQQTDPSTQEPSPTVPLDTPFGTVQGPPEAIKLAHSE
jgi:hypothetical protein